MGFQSSTSISFPSCCRSTGLPDAHYCTHRYLGAWDPNPDHHAYETVLFTHEPSPQSKEAVLIQGVSIGNFYFLKVLLTKLLTDPTQAGYKKWNCTSCVVCEWGWVPDVKTKGGGLQHLLPILGRTGCFVTHGKPQCQGTIGWPLNLVTY